MPRGFVRCVYEADDGTLFALMVDADEAEDGARGWATEGAELLPLLPRGWLPRRVVGIDSSGRQQEARVAFTGAALWSGAVTSWSFMTSDGTTDTAQLVLRQAERPRGSPFSGG